MIGKLLAGGAAVLALTIGAGQTLAQQAPAKAAADPGPTSVAAAATTPQEHRSEGQAAAGHTVKTQGDGSLTSQIRHTLAGVPGQVGSTVGGTLGGAGSLIGGTVGGGLGVGRPSAAPPPSRP